MKLSDILSAESSWEQLGRSREPIVLYGTGNGADRVIDELGRLGIGIDGVIASDGFVRKRQFRGHTVESLKEAEHRLGDFTVALGFATAIPEVIENIKSISRRHRLIVPVVPVFGTRVWNRIFLEQNLDILLKCRELLYDDESKRVFDNMAYFQFTGELTLLFDIESRRRKALTDILRLTPCEDMLDLGAYRGDTIAELLDVTGGCNSVLALEPDTKSFKKLTEFCDTHESVEALPYAVWDSDATLGFTGGGGRQSALDTSGKTEVQALSIDNLLQKMPRRITYVKMDVEGAEERALRGMRTLLQTQKPKLSIAAYHRTSDLFTLIPLIKELEPDYKIYLRHHPYIPCWDTNLYCI